MIIKPTTTHKRQVIDITERVQQSIGRGKIDNGAVIISALHTTCAIAVAELDPGTDKDLLDFLEALIPNIDWRHSHDPGHVPAHLLSTLIGTSIALPVEKAKVTLGSWQSIVLIELDGPRDRETTLSLLSSKI